jgi:23S rRNA pseudouridine1911/1915/1917 synthase
VNSKKTDKIARMTETKKILPNYTANPPGPDISSLDTSSADTDSADIEPLEAEALAPLHFKVPHALGGLRLDQALAKLLPEYSRSRLQEWVTQGQVTLNGATATIKQKVWGGEAIALIPQSDPAEQAYLAEDIQLDIIYEDEHILIINKPVGLVVHPGNGNWQGTLLNALLHHDPHLATVPRAGIVHRLDKDTSGLLVVAKTLVAQTDLVRQLQARTVSREYLALVHGEVIRAGRVDAPIDRHPSQRTKMAVVEGGKPAVTHYSVAESFPGCTLLRCKLETGRTHQIRVHMASIRHPLVGDHIYIKGAQKCPLAMRDTLATFPRQALHAERLGLEHPDTGEYMEWQVDMPLDMQQLLTVIRQVAVTI